MRLNNEYLGTATISPNRDVIAGEISTWEITYTAGKYGIDDKGHIRLAWRSVSDWEIPQFDRPKDFGYSTISTTAKADIKCSYSSYERHFGNSIIIDVNNGFLKEGDTITIKLGDTSFGSLGMRAQTFRESEHEIRVLVDPFGTLRFEELPYRLKLNIVGGHLNDIQAIVPATVRPNEEFEVLVRALDAYGNACDKFIGDVELSIPELDKSEYAIPFLVSLSNEDKGTKRIKAKLYTEGPFHIKVEHKEKNISSISNGGMCNTDKYKLYFGDMHGQTSFTVGTGSLDEYYTFARDVAGIDFTGWQGNDFEVDDDKWNQVRAKTKEYNEENKFLVYLGYEWSGITPTGGDHNIFFLDDNEKFYPSSNWSSKYQKLEQQQNANPISELWTIFGDRKDVMAIPHIGGRYGNLDFFNSKFISAIEIHSHHGTFEWFAMEAMKRRLKVGFVASSDDHTCRPGLSYPLSGNGKSASSSFDVASGYMGVYSEDLTKKSIWEAIKSRRCYASTFGRIALDVKADGHFMGEDISLSKNPELKIKALGSAPIDNIKIYNWDKLVCSKDLLERSSKKIRISWSGVVRRTRTKACDWSGTLYVENGSVVSAETFAFDRADQGITNVTDKTVKWVSSTSGDIDGLILDIDFNEDTIIHFNTNVGQYSFNINEILDETIEVDFGGENLGIQISKANEELTTGNEYLEKCFVELSKTIDITTDKENAFWVKVTQIDGHMAWSSPIFINQKREEE